MKLLLEWNPEAFTVPPWPAARRRLRPTEGQLSAVLDLLAEGEAEGAIAFAGLPTRASLGDPFFKDFWLQGWGFGVESRCCWSP